MNNFLKILTLAVIMYIAGTANAQIIVTEDDMPASGESFLTSVSIDLLGFDYVSTGEDYFWNFSELEEQFQQIDTFVSVMDLPVLYQFVFIPFVVSTHAQEMPSFDMIPGFPVTDPYRFYKNSSNAYLDAGMAVTFSGVPIPMKYDSADVVYDLPLNYGDVYSSTSVFQSQIPVIGYMYSKRERSSTVDGWGTLVTPFGEFEVLRVLSEINEHDSIYIDSLGIGLPVERNYTEYKWLAKGTGLPLLQITQEGLLLNASYLDSLRSPAGMNDQHTENFSVKVFPNPVCNNSIRIATAFDTPQALRIEMHNVSGMLIGRIEGIQVDRGRRETKINLSTFKPGKGAYILKVYGEGFVRTFKLILI